MANWAVTLDYILYSKIKKELVNAFESSYPDMLITSTDRTPQEAQFPTIYIHSLSGVETGNTTEAKTLNAIVCTLQIEVTVTDGEWQAREIMAEIVDILKSMGFEATSMPVITTTEDTYIATARFRRTICKSDKW